MSIYKEKLIKEPQFWFYWVGIITLSAGIFTFYDSADYKTAMIQTLCLGSIITSFVFYLIQRGMAKIEQRLMKDTAEVLKDEL